MQTQTKAVQFTQDNVMKCQCDNCSVQANSSCAMDRLQQVNQAMQGGQMGSQGGPGAMQSMTTQTIGGLSAQDVPQVYCSTGQSTCGDLDYTQNCICPTCDVWRENDLANYKYCRDGDATRIG